MQWCDGPSDPAYKPVFKLVSDPEMMSRLSAAPPALFSQVTSGTVGTALRKGAFVTTARAVSAFFYIINRA
jgi:hypothetical protein